MHSTHSIISTYALCQRHLLLGISTDNKAAPIQCNVNLMFKVINQLSIVIVRWGHILHIAISSRENGLEVLIYYFYPFHYELSENYKMGLF